MAESHWVSNPPLVGRFSNLTTSFLRNWTTRDTGNLRAVESTMDWSEQPRHCSSSESSPPCSACSMRTDKESDVALRADEELRGLDLDCEVSRELNCRDIVCNRCSIVSSGISDRVCFLLLLISPLFDSFRSVKFKAVLSEKPFSRATMGLFLPAVSLGPKATASFNFTLLLELLFAVLLAASTETTTSARHEPVVALCEWTCTKRGADVFPTAKVAPKPGDLRFEWLIEPRNPDMMGCLLSTSVIHNTGDSPLSARDL